MAVRMAAGSRMSASSHCTLAGNRLHGARMSTTRTWWPSAASASTRFVPTCPAPPVTRASMSEHRRAGLDVEHAPFGVEALENGVPTGECGARHSCDDPAVCVPCRQGGSVALSRIAEATGRRSFAENDFADRDPDVDSCFHRPASVTIVRAPSPAHESNGRRCTRPPSSSSPSRRPRSRCRRVSPL